jgi:hypothetical protein
MLRLIYNHHGAVRESKNNKAIFTVTGGFAIQLRKFPFHFYFLEQPDYGYILAETCSWLIFLNTSSVRTSYAKLPVIFHLVNMTKYEALQSSLSMADNTLYRNMTSCTGG